ncbi:MAG: hypothetical protein NT067_02475 [Candidatus Diapherotrites archaeon]|nr:hypothetical protein [Candidatus Diapherotrites archaeon]
MAIGKKQLILYGKTAIVSVIVFFLQIPFPTISTWLIGMSTGILAGVTSAIIVQSGD